MTGEFVWENSIRSNAFYKISVIIVHSFVTETTVTFTAVCWNYFWIYIPFPIYCIFIEIEPRSKAGNSSAGRSGTGRETLRLRPKGPATVEEVVCCVQLVSVLHGHVRAFMVIGAGKKGKTMRLNKLPYILTKARLLIHCPLNQHESYWRI